MPQLLPSLPPPSALPLSWAQPPPPRGTATQAQVPARPASRRVSAPLAGALRANVQAHAPVPGPPRAPSLRSLATRTDLDPPTRAATKGASVTLELLAGVYLQLPSLRPRIPLAGAMALYRCWLLLSDGWEDFWGEATLDADARAHWAQREQRALQLHRVTSGFCTLLKPQFCQVAHAALPPQEGPPHCRVAAQSYALAESIDEILPPTFRQPWQPQEARRTWPVPLQLLGFQIHLLIGMRATTLTANSLWHVENNAQQIQLYLAQMPYGMGETQQIRQALFETLWQETQAFLINTQKRQKTRDDIAFIASAFQCRRIMERADTLHGQEAALADGTEKQILRETLRVATWLTPTTRALCERRIGRT